MTTIAREEMELSPQDSMLSEDQLALMNIEFFHVKRDELESAEYDKASIYQQLHKYNATLAYPLSDEIFAQETADLLIPEPGPQPVPDLAAKLAHAIETKDIAALLTNEIIDYLATLKRLSLLAYGIKEAEIKETFGKALNKAIFKQCVNEAERRQVLSEEGKKKDVADIASQWARDHRDLWAYDEVGQCWRMFNGDYWEMQADKGSDLDRYAVVALQEAGIAVNSSNMLNCFQRIARGHCKRPFIHPNKVNFANGTLNLDTMRLENHDKDDNFTYCLPYSYNPYGTCTGIGAFLRSIIGEFHQGQFVTNEHGIQAFMAHVGLALMEDTDLQKALIALGVPGSGKTTLLDLVNLICGLKPKQYVPHDVFSRELEGKRSRYSHNQKRVACLDEVPADAFEDEETVKQMIAHSGVPMRGIHKDEKEDNQWKPKLFLVANDDPSYRDISGAIKRRLIIVRCPVQRYDEPEEGQPGQDPLLLKKLEPELGVFAAACIHMALAVRGCGYYPQSASMKRDLDQLATAGNPLKACLAEKFILDTTAHTSTSTLYAVYDKFCDDEIGNVKKLGSPKFASALCAMGKGISAKKLDGQRALLGIRLRVENEPIPQEQNYQDSALLIDVRRLDGWDGTWTAENVSRPLHEPASQATSQVPWTAGTAKSEISDLLKNTCSQHDAYVSHHSTEQFPILPSQPSTDDVNQLHKPRHGMDGTPKVSLSAVHQPSDGTPTPPDTVACPYPLTIAEDAHPLTVEKFEHHRRVRVVVEKEPGWITLIGKHRLGVVLDGSAFRTDHPVHHVSIVLEQ